MPDWVGEWADKLVAWFGPVGAFAVVLLGVALWAIWNRTNKIDALQEQIAATASAHASAIAEKEAECVAEKAAYRDDLDAQLKRQIETFMVRDDQKRNDVIKCFEKLDAFIERVVGALATVDKTLTDLRIQIATNRS